MRLNDFQQKKIHEIMTDIFGGNTKILLFGSRLDDQKKGGDIDLFVESELAFEELFQKKIQALSRLKKELGDRKIDIVVHSLKDADLPLIVREARATGISI